MQCETLGAFVQLSSIERRYMALASERPVLQTTFDLDCEDIKELLPGQALIVNKHGESSLHQILEPKENSACSFERIYSHVALIEIYIKNVKKLGEQLTEKVLEAIDYDTNHTVISFIPNTAEVAFYGLVTRIREMVEC